MNAYIVLVFAHANLILLVFLRTFCHPQIEDRREEKTYNIGSSVIDHCDDILQNEHDKIRELTQQLAIEKKRATAYKRHLEMVFEHIEEHSQSLSKRIQGVVESIKDFESRERQV